MAFDFYLPDIGEGVVEGEIVGWKVKEGDKVKLDQPLVEVMTDKATVELPSPRAGTVKKINFKDGDICPVGKVLVVIEEDGARAPEPATASRGTVARRAEARARARARRMPPVGDAGDAQQLAAIEVVDATATRERVLATPATRRLARQLGVEIGRVPATGKHGRVTTDDVKSFKAAPAPRRSAAVSVRADVDRASGGDEERIPLRGMRKKIAESMSRSVHTAAHFTYVEEIDMTELVAVRERAKARAAERGVKLNYLPFIVKAVRRGPQEVADAQRVARRGDAGDRAQEVLPHRDRGPGPAGPRGLGRARRRQALDLRSRARDRAARRSRAQRHRDARRAHRLDVHDQLARQARRRARDADHQLPRGRDRRRAQDRGEAGGAQRPDRRRAT